MRTNKLQILIGLIIGLAIISCNNQKNGSDAFGNFEADDQLVSSEIAGKLLSCNFEEGMTLSKGAEIAVVDTVPILLQISQLKSQQLTIQARKQSVKSQLAVVEQQKKNFEVDKARIDNMLKDGAATQKQKDDITGNLELLAKQKESTRSQETVLTGESEVVDTQLAQLQDKLNRCRIVSPINGLVLERYKKAGELVGQGQSLCRIADVSSLNLRVFVSGDQLPHLKIGQKVKVLIDDTATTNKTLEGTVSWISSEAEFTPKIIQTKVERVKLVYAVKIKVANDGALKIGMPGEIKFLD
ncbi:MAG: HlyD family efflux transporter periplasmic adaptor subunit [Prolixibacteraceae bacterium]|nr:HlyD family efflux transporter periplasmic adaptor subunit [Prolixibacteraceae bacterium]